MAEFNSIEDLAGDIKTKLDTTTIKKGVVILYQNIGNSKKTKRTQNIYKCNCCGNGGK